MLRYRRSLGLLLVLAVSGCTGRPTPPIGPRIDPAASADCAFELYDRNRDGLLDADELAASPALAASLRRLDRDDDGRVSRGELHDRLQAWVESRSVLVDALAEVSLNGQPLAGATVTVEPDPFLGEGRKPAAAVTDIDGLAAFRGHDPRLPGLHLGFYRVRITKHDAAGAEQLPAKYNASSELGIEAAGDKSNLTQFRLASR